MSYLFRCIFSGPCAYVPNKLTGDPTPPDQVKSWSVILRQLQQPVEVAPGDIPIPPHYAVLQYPTELFETDFAPDLVFRRDPLGPEFGLALLSGARVRVRSAELRPLNPNLGPVNHLEPPPPVPPDNELRSLNFLPRMEPLLGGAGTFGNAAEGMFRLGTGLPFASNIAGHVLITGGDLFTNALTHEEGTPTQAPGIWGFRIPQTTSEPVPHQAVAHSVGLELGNLTTPIALELTDVSRTRMLWLKTMPAAGLAQIEIKNREFDEIVRLADSEVSVGDIDRDFKILYRLSGSQTNPCPLPFLIRDQGLGTRRTTCSGALFENFDSALFSDTLSQWAALP